MARWLFQANGALASKTRCFCFIVCILLAFSSSFCYLIPIMPRPPEQQSGHEIIREPFLLSSRFATKEAAEVPYNALQQILREREDVDFSVYRILQNWQEEQPTKKPWFVVTLGETPPEPVVKQVTEIINQGEVSPLPNQVVLQLAERRLERIQQGRPFAST